MTAWVMALIWLACCLGCIKEPASEPTVLFDDATVPVDQITEHPARPTPSPDPFIDTVPVEELPGVVPRGFTGALVYGNPKQCPPCRMLCEDIAWLRDNHGWTLSVHKSPGEFSSADWVFSLPDKSHDVTPAIDYYEGGVCIGQHIGYVGSPDDPGRLDELRQVVRKHPRAKPR